MLFTLFISLYISYLKYYIWFGVNFSWLGLVFIRVFFRIILIRCLKCSNPLVALHNQKNEKTPNQNLNRFLYINRHFLVKIYGFQEITIIFCLN